MLSGEKWDASHSCPNLLMALQAEISGDFYILESLPYWMWALGCQASHATAFVFCFCSWAGGMSLLFTSIWRLQTQVKKGKRKEGRKRNRQRRMSFSVSTPHCISSPRGPGSAGGQTTQQPQDWGEWEDEVWILASPLDSSAILYEILHPFQPPFPHLWNDVSFLLPPQVYHKDPLSHGCENMLQSVRFPHKCEAFLSITIWQMQSLVLLTQLSFTALGNLDFAYKLGKGGNICL